VDRAARDEDIRRCAPRQRRDPPQSGMWPSVRAAARRQSVAADGQDPADGVQSGDQTERNWEHSAARIAPNHAERQRMSVDWCG
jgi:hypothetical protein